MILSGPRLAVSLFFLNFLIFSNMKIYSIDFAPMWPVPSCLIIAAENETNALKLAEETITHTEVR